MKQHLLVGLAWAAALTSPAASLPEPITLISSSKQFIVRGFRYPQKTEPVPRNSDWLLLEPAPLVVACERVKQAVELELGAGGAWHGRIQVELQPLQFDKEEIVCTATHSPEGWAYRIEMPDQVEASQLIRALVGALLTESANRGARERAVELPPWLIPGLAAHLRAGPLSSFVLEADRPVMRQRVGQEALDPVRARLQATAPLTVDQLNWPEPGPDHGGGAELYADCAHLLVRELLRLHGGRDCLRSFLRLLPEHLNWQLAFFRAFTPHFQRMMELEKWWSMVLVQFTGRHPGKALEAAEAWRQLEAILYTPVQVRLKRTELPHTSYESLDGLLRDWEYPRLRPVFEHKVAALLALRAQAPPEVASLVEEYRRLLETHLTESAHAARDSSKFRFLYPGVVASTARSLKPLETRRHQLQPPPGPAASTARVSTTNAPPLAPSPSPTAPP